MSALLKQFGAVLTKMLNSEHEHPSHNRAKRIAVLFKDLLKKISSEFVEHPDTLLNKQKYKEGVRWLKEIIGRVFVPEFQANSSFTSFDQFGKSVKLEMDNQGPLILQWLELDRSSVAPLTVIYPVNTLVGFIHPLFQQTEPKSIDFILNAGLVSSSSTLTSTLYPAQGCELCCIQENGKIHNRGSSFSKKHGGIVINFESGDVKFYSLEQFSETRQMVVNTPNTIMLETIHWLQGSIGEEMDGTFEAKEAYYNGLGAFIIEDENGGSLIRLFTMNFYPPLADNLKKSFFVHNYPICMNSQKQGWISGRELFDRISQLATYFQQNGMTVREWYYAATEYSHGGTLILSEEEKGNLDNILNKKWQGYITLGV